MTAREVIRILKKDGWYRVKSNSGGHLQFRHPEKKGRTTVPNHRGDISMDTVAHIEEQSGVKLLKR